MILSFISHQVHYQRIQVSRSISDRVGFYLPLIILILLFLPFTVSSQTYSFKHYSSSDGLELSSVNTIFQDSKGSLWFGGVGGAFRYDGSRFIPYLSNGNERSVVTRFAEDKNGVLWVATEGNGAAKIRYGDTNAVEWMSTLNSKVPSDSIYSILCDNTGNIIFGTRQGVFIQWSKGASTRISSASGLKSNWVRYMLKDYFGNLWVATNGGVTRFTFDGENITERKLVHDAGVLTMTSLSDGTVLMGTTEGREEINKGVFGYSHDSLFKIINLKEYTDAIKTQSLLQDSRGNLWIGTGGAGLIVKENNGTHRIRSGQGLVNESVGCILEDRDGSLWFATGNGVIKLPRRYTLNFSEQQGISGVLSVMVDRSNAVWCGGFRSFTRIDPNGVITAMNTNPEMAQKVCLGIVEDKTGRLWIATNKGLVSFSSGKFSTVRVRKSPENEYIYSLTPDNSNGIWVGLKGEIIHLVNGTIFESFDHSNGIPDADINAITMDRLGRIWFSANGEGGGILEHGSVRSLRIQEGLPDDDVTMIKEDSYGRVWFITEKGIAYWKKDEFVHLTRSQLPVENGEVTVIHEDKERHIWFGTWRGVIEWSDSVIARYDTRDGLSGDIVQAIAEDGFGNLWIGTRGGLTKLPHSERVSYIPLPSVTIERIQDYESRSVVSTQRSIPYDERIVTFKAGSTSYFDEQNIEFQFQLYGFESDWNPITKQRIIRYTTLPSGDYTLFVRARNRNGMWTNPVSYSFTILPPFWKTWWFITAMVIFFSGIIYATIKQRINKLKKEQKSQELFSKQLMEVYESERQRIASELHDGLGQNLLIIANRAKMGLKKEDLSLMQKELEIISSSALESINDVRKITYNLHPLQIDEVGITTAVESMLKRIASLIDNVLSFTIENIDDVLFDKDRIHFYRLIQETLNNAIKHSGAKNIEVTVVKEEKTIRAIINDDGKGFNTAIKKEGYGLRSINERIKILGGQFTIESSPGTGTIIKIIIPIENKERQRV